MLRQAADIAAATAAPKPAAEPLQTIPSAPVGVLDAGGELLYETLQGGSPAVALQRFNMDDLFRGLEQQRPAVLVTDIVTSDGDISDVLKGLKRQHPDLLTVVVIALRDTSMLMELINETQV